MKNFNILSTLVLIFVLGCSNANDPNYDKYYESLSGLDAKASIAKGNEWKFSAPKIKTHVTPREVIFEFPDGRVVKKNLPDNSMYIAIAPYINTTHTCEQHYPSSCDGEIKEKTVNLNATDNNGNVVFSGNINTLKNGFFELWLPRDKFITITVNYDNKSGEEIIPTKDNSRTCITTIKLK